MVSSILSFLKKVLVVLLICKTVDAHSFSSEKLKLHQHSGVVAVSFDPIEISERSSPIGLMGLHYRFNNPTGWYGGIGGYGSVTGSQGGLFILDVQGGIEQHISSRWLMNINMTLGGGGGGSGTRLVGSGFLWRPAVGLLYDWGWSRTGIHYSYFGFPNGTVRSHQWGVDWEIPYDFYSLSYQQDTTLQWPITSLQSDTVLTVLHDDFILLLQAYSQKAGTLDHQGIAQRNTIGIAGAEWEHFFLKQSFVWLKLGGAFHGIKNGYMDFIGGIGHRWAVSHLITLIPELGLGTGGGGQVNTGGGALVNPSLNLELPLTETVGARLGGGLLWAPTGAFKTTVLSTGLVYHTHAKAASATADAALPAYFRIKNWRVQLLNQVYWHPARTETLVDTPVNLLAVQIDQILSSHFFVIYQAASAYAGHAVGGLANGMVGLGIQSQPIGHYRWQFFGESLVGAAGGGDLALGSGAVAELMVGVHYPLSSELGLQVSLGQIQALQGRLKTPIANVGLTWQFGRVC